MTKSKEEISIYMQIRKRYVRIFAILVALFIAIAVYAADSLSWFAGNSKVSGSDMSISTNPILADITVYEYTTDGLLVQTDNMLLDLQPGEEKSFVLIISHNGENDLKSAFSFNEISVNYYGLQACSSLGELNTFTLPYRISGDYVYGENGNVDGNDVTTEQYISFTEPVTNAITLDTCVVEMTQANLIGTNAASYALTQLQTNENFLPVYTPTASPTATPTATPEVTPTATPVATPTATPTVAPTPEPTATPNFLYTTTGYGITANNAVSYTRDEFHQISGDQPDFGEFDTVTLVNGNVYAFAIKFTFISDKYAHSVTMNIGGTDRTVTLRNSNPYMYQKVNIGNINTGFTIYTAP